jgi:hypothetical protein
MTAFESTASCLYYSLLHSYLLQKQDLRDSYDVLVDHYKTNPESLKILSKNDLIRLKKIQDDILNNRYTLFSGSLDLSVNLPEFREEKGNVKHADLCNRIIGDPKILESIIGPINYLSREHPTPFGPIDIVAQSLDTIYVIEVKTSKSDHSIIGQVMKYFIALSLKLIIKHYDNVKMITLCPGYDKASYFGLKQIGARPLIINTKTLEINELESNSLLI